MVHRCRRDVVREAHAVDLLLGLERTGFGDWRRVGDVTERGEPLGRERGRLANHAVCGLRPERLEPHPSVRARRGVRELEHAGNRRPRIRRVVPCEEEDVVGPGRADCVVLARLEAHERRLALEREDARRSPSCPRSSSGKDVVRRADDERVELALVHERTHAVELRVVARPRHVPSITRRPRASRAAESADRAARGRGRLRARPSSRSPRRRPGRRRRRARCWGLRRIGDERRGQRGCRRGPSISPTTTGVLDRKRLGRTRAAGPASRGRLPRRHSGW